LNSTHLLTDKPILHVHNNMTAKHV
jgi:hypothetical protein